MPELWKCPTCGLEVVITWAEPQAVVCGRCRAIGLGKTVIKTVQPRKATLGELFEMQMESPAAMDEIESILDELRRQP